MKKNPANSSERESIIKRVFTEPIPEAIMTRITPLIFFSIIGLVITVFLLIYEPTRGFAPFSAALSLVLLGYSFWLKLDIIRKGYDEILFRVIDFTYLTSLSRSPTGMLLVKDGPESSNDRGMYHIAVSGKEDLPHADWIIRVYVPAGAEPSEFNGRKYFPTVFGYRIEGERTD